ncbi:MAG: hypothetical protein COW65_03080 [Cytophagales bacterium CG18_big_fil_WC_8_21_14_2_50_42_9]|nr:MAG: hypothetical protein COW65_03080 [Cytophagales bacterium CG18_big_fil_WC_8_21_14_2_50_42_9]
MKRILPALGLIIGLLMVFSGKVFAQQEPMYSQYMFNGLILNPAYAGSTEGLSAAALYRNQWVGVEGAPVTQTLSVHAPIEKKNIGLGLSIINDKIGVTNTWRMNGSYAFRIRTNTGLLSMGLQAGLAKNHADYTQLALDPQGNPDAQFNEVQNSLVFYFGPGLYYYTGKFYAGVSSPSFLRAPITNLDGDAGYPKHARHYFLTTGYVFNVSENLQIKPSTLVKIAEGAPVQFDLNTNVWFYNLVGLGASYRTNNGLVGILELQLARQFRLGYSYDQPLSKVSRYTANTHELMLRFDLFSGHQQDNSPRLF